MKVFLVYPHQLFEDTAIFKLLNPKEDLVVLVEDSLFFTQYSFHPKKILFHQRTMKKYADYLKGRGYLVKYIESNNLSKTENIVEYIETFTDKNKISETNLFVYDPTDNWLEKKLRKVFGDKIEFLDTPMFINSKTENTSFFTNPDGSQKKPFMKTFYEWQRNRLKILMLADKKPVGGRYSFDSENRKKLPKDYVETERIDFSEDADLGFATDFVTAKEVLNNFLKHKLKDFGVYEDAISKHFDFINHSVLTPYLNVGLLTPDYVVQQTLRYAKASLKMKDKQIPLNSLEGFLRRVIGWREFMRAMYDMHGTKMRKANFFKHTKKLPYEFWTAKTGNIVLDTTIKKVINNAYNHHIERLMVLGNFMLLSEYDPNDVYRWFMEMYIDSYDWVMVPNVYGMSQFADGGIFATKPYISGANYILKMSDYKRDGVWDKDWDDKFWRFLGKHRVFLSRNPRFKMLVSKLDKIQ